MEGIGIKTTASISLYSIALILALATLSLADAEPGNMLSFLIRKIPPRPAYSLTGSQFSEQILHLDRRQREEAIAQQLDMGNLPDFMRKLKPVRFSRSSRNGNNVELTIFVMPDYLAVGSDNDFILLPMALRTALDVAARFGFILPTRRIVDAIFRQSAFHLPPQPLPAGPQMRSTAYYVAQIAQQRLALFSSLGELMAGHKKYVVLSNRLIGREGKIAIYGFIIPRATRSSLSVRSMALITPTTVMASV